MKHITTVILLGCLIVHAAQAQIWQPQNSGTTERLSSVWFNNPTTGWVCGKGGLLLATTDAGANWTPQTTPFTAELRTIFFLDSQTGWIAGDSGKILKTTNGGATWTSQSLAITNSISAIRFTDANKGWFSANYSMVGSTTDGGTTWTTKNVQSPHVANVFMINQNTGWLCGTAVSGGTGTLLKTTNGGGQWVGQTNSGLSVQRNFYGLAFTDANNGWLTTAGGYIRHTTDGGATTWTGQTSGTTNDLQHIIMLSATTGWICGKGGTILHTTNGGTLWSGEPSTVTTTLWDIRFVNDSTGWCVGDSGVILSFKKFTPTKPVTLFSPNGGNNWQIGTSQSILWYATTATAVKIEYSVDGGSNWTTMTGNAPASSGSYSFIVPNAPSKNCLVRVSDAANPSNFDISDAPFSILPALTGRDYCVPVTATVSSAPPAIALSWTTDQFTTGYIVARKLKADTSWTTLSTLPGTATGYTDNTVSDSSAYEYRITKTHPLLTGYGYIYAGINVKPVHSRGAVLLLVDNSYATALATELTRYEMDLIAEGWTVWRHDLSATTPVTEIRDYIKGVYNGKQGGLRSIVLFGDLPAPYSGDFAPDGHTERIGAQPADVYYADVNGTWTDATVNHNNNTNTQNPNVPGDGRFDQSTLPSDVELEFGRIDLHGMTLFGATETELYRQYLNKDHNFRTKAFDMPRRMIGHDGISSGRPASGYAAYRSFSPMFGTGMTVALNTTPGFNFLDSLERNQYLWSYIEGGGSDTSIGTTLTSRHWATKTLNTVFTCTYGSYHVEWNRGPNNFCRAPLASASPALTHVWSGIAPSYMFHRMALGETIGSAVLLSANNSTVYSPGDNGNAVLARAVSVCLQGDPTLVLHTVAKPTNLKLTQSGNKVDVQWTAPNEQSIHGYYIYRATGVRYAFALIAGPVVGTTFTDTTPVSGNNVYMVRTVKLESSPSGTYHNLGPGVIDSIAVTIQQQLPLAVTLIAPRNDSVNVPSMPNLQWSMAQYASSYQVTVATDMQFTSPVFDSTQASAAIGTGALQPGTVYYWRVRGKNANGDGPWSTVWKFATVVAAPAVPNLLSPADAANAIPLSGMFVWDSSARASLYELQLSQRADFVTTVVTNPNVTTTTLGFSNLQPQTQYFWRVRATNVGGTSAWSSVWSFTTVTIVGVPDEKSTASPITLYPNPASSHITVVVPGSVPPDMASPTGAAIESSRITPTGIPGEYRIDVRGLASGVYTVRAGRWIGRVVVIR